MQIPLFEYIFEIPPKYNALKLHVIVNHIDPQTTMYLGHHPKRFYQLLILVDIFIFEIVRLQEWFNGNFWIDLCGGFISYSQEEQKNVFEIDDRNHHARIYVFYDDSVDFFSDHGQHKIWQFWLFDCWFDADVITFTSLVELELLKDIAERFLAQHSHHFL